MALENTIRSIVYPMAFPGPGNNGSVLRGEGNEQYVIQTILQLINDPYFSGIEISRIKSGRVRERVADILRASNKVVTYAAQIWQLYNEDDLIPLSDISSIDETIRLQAVDRLRRCIDEAYELGCKNFSFLSGRDPILLNPELEPIAPQLRQQAISQLCRSIHELCVYADERARKLSCEPLTLMLVAFDRRPNEPGQDAFKGCLIGPYQDAIQVAEMVANTYHHENFGLLFDTAHMAENGEAPEVLKFVAHYLKGVHLSNAILDPNHPEARLRYGDTHPKFGIPGGTLDYDLLIAHLKCLVEIDFQGLLGFEIRPIGAENSTDVINYAKSFLDEGLNAIPVNYAFKKGYMFKFRDFFPDDLFDELSTLKVEHPELVEAELKLRKQRDRLTDDGKLVIIAADHPARMVTSVGSDPVAMGDRMEYLGRILRALTCSHVDGVMATADIFEDLALVNYLYKQAGGKSFLDNKVLIACANRGGLEGLEHEMFDPVTAYRDPKMVKELKLDGVKLLFRISEPDRYDRYVIQTMAEIARYIDAAHDAGLPIFLEPLPVRKEGNRYVTVRDPDRMIRTLAVASGLSRSTANVWMKIPYTPGFGRVVKAYSGPILILGGAATGDPVTVLADFVRAMGDGANVRGALVGRNLLFPGNDDPAAIAEAIFRIVHEGMLTTEAVKLVAESRGLNMEFFAPCLRVKKRIEL